MVCHVSDKGQSVPAACQPSVVIGQVVSRLVNLRPGANKLCYKQSRFEALLRGRALLGRILGPSVLTDIEGLAIV